MLVFMCASMSGASSISLPYFMRQLVSLNLELTDLALLAGQTVPGTPFYTSPTRAYRHAQLDLAFNVDAGDLKSVSHRHLPST